MVLVLGQEGSARPVVVVADEGVFQSVVAVKVVYIYYPALFQDRVADLLVLVYEVVFAYSLIYRVIKF